MMVTNVTNAIAAQQAQTTTSTATTEAGYLTDEEAAGVTSTATADILTGTATSTNSTINKGTTGTASTTNASGTSTGSTGETAAKQVKNADGTDMKGVFSKKGSDGKNEVIIKKEAGDVTVDQSMLKRLFGDTYDSNSVTVTLDQDNLKTADKVGKVNITTDVGKVVVDNDNDYKEVGGDSNVAKADLTVSGQKDKLIIAQDVDVTTTGWNVKGDAKTQNIGSDLKYNISGCDVAIEGHVTNTFDTTDLGAQGLMAGNKVDVKTTDVGKVSDATTMTNDFQVGKEIKQTGIPQTVLDFIKEKGLDENAIVYKDAGALGLGNDQEGVNHFMHGANGGKGLIVMKMTDGSWVVSGDKSPQTFQFSSHDLGGSGTTNADGSSTNADGTAKAGTTTAEKAKVSDPFNKANYSATNSSGSGIQTTTVDIDSLKQMAKGSVYGIKDYVVTNSVLTEGSVDLQGTATQSIDVTGINYSLSANSGNTINGAQNVTKGKIDEVHTRQYTGEVDDLKKDPKITGLSLEFAKNMIGKGLDKQTMGTDRFDFLQIGELEENISKDPEVIAAGKTGKDVLNEAATDLGTNYNNLTMKDLKTYAGKAGATAAAT